MRNKMIIGENVIGGKRESILSVLIIYLISWMSWGTLVLFDIPAKSSALLTLLYLLGGLSPTIKGTSNSKPRPGITCSQLWPQC